MSLKLTHLLSARAAAATGAALLALGGGGVVLASHQLNPGSSVSQGSDTPPTLSPGTGGGVESSGTGNPFGSPGAHGQAVVSAVASCRAATSPTPSGSQHGIGQCVAKVASSNGQAHRSGHPTPPPTP
jgi:hypothetical protein